MSRLISYTLLALLLCFCTSVLSAQGRDSVPVFQGFSGGCMLHAGYLFGHQDDAPVSPAGMTIGIGGAVRVNLWKHLRVGGEGYISTLHSTVSNCHSDLSRGSYIRSGWGGFLADVCWRKDKVWPFVGATLGGGATRSLFIMSGSQRDWQPEKESYLHKQSFFVCDPFVGIDWCMTPSVHLSCRLDWLLAIHRNELVMPTGPRLYIGFMFCH